MKKLLKTLLPNSTINNLKSLVNSIDFQIIKIASKTNFLSNTYYFINGKFNEEHSSVLKGRVRYESSVARTGYNHSLLRRNIHRLEKGLIMRPRRKKFAEGFIMETVNCYKHMNNSKDLSESEKKWAIDVLDEYFNSVENSPIIDKARAIYTDISRENLESLNISPEFPSSSNKFKPYSYHNLEPLKLSYLDLKSLFIHRRSVRWFENKKVPVELIEKASHIASFAPSACNRQPYAFYFCNDKYKATQIAKCALGTTGFAENIPSIIAIVGDLSAYPAERDRHLIYIDSSLAAMQLMLALETLGLSTCSLNWPDIVAQEKKIRRHLKLESYQRIIMLLAVGYADKEGYIPYSQKKEGHLVLKDISNDY